jgi:tetratricopeptide (TPR) repeat protein
MHGLTPLAMNFIMKFYADYRLETLHMALEQAGRALSIDDNDEYSHAVMSGVRGQLSQWELARMHVERALSLNPNSVFATEFYALWLIRTGRAPEALETLEVALQRDPLQPPWYWEMRGMALLQEKRYGDVIESVSRKNPLQSWDHAALALAHAQFGHASEARQEAAIAVQMQPNFSIAGWAKTDPYKDPEHLQHILAGLRKAGLPE